MTDRVFPSSKPTTNGTTTVPAAATTTVNGGATTANATTTATPSTNKSHLYNPTSRPPYRPPPYNRRNRHRSGRSICCCCCFWTTLTILLLLLLAAIAGAALYILYRPHRPEFTIPSLRIHRLNLTTAADTTSSHVSTLFNLTITSKNPNSHFTFFYDAFTVSAFSSDDVFLGNGTVSAFVSSKKNETFFRDVVVSGSTDLDVDSSKALRSEVKKKNGDVGLVIQMDTRVKVKMDGLNTKKIGIRVSCEGIKGSIPKSTKTPTVAVTTGSKCKVDLRVKIWKWTF